jgi:hypothetical protein
MEVLSPQEPEIADASTVTGVQLPHDSMVTVRLSESSMPDFDNQSATLANRSRESAQEALTEIPKQLARNSRTIDYTPIPSRHSSVISTADDTMESPNMPATRRASHSSTGSADGDVNWEELEKTEDREPRNQDSEDVSSPLSIHVLQH